jgi:hypothetical protein
MHKVGETVVIDYRLAASSEGCNGYELTAVPPNTRLLKDEEIASVLSHFQTGKLEFHDLTGHIIPGFKLTGQLTGASWDKDLEELTLNLASCTLQYPDSGGTKNLKETIVHTSMGVGNKIILTDDGRRLLISNVPRLVGSISLN